MKRGQRPYPNLIERHILASLNKPNECWPYPGYKRPNGYALVYMKDRPKPVTAHVAAYRMCVGPVPEGLELDHLCRNPSCCNPNHLEPVTHRENMLRSPTAASAVCSRKTHCIRGHPFVGENVVINSQGARQCRTCFHIRAKAAYAKRMGRDVRRWRTQSERDRECAQGHLRTPDNTYIAGDGQRTCADCCRERYQRKKAEGRHAMNLS